MSPRTANRSGRIALAGVLWLTPLSATALASPQPGAAKAVRAAPRPGDPHRGAAIYEARCSACHSLDANRIGPSHRGVFGRRAGTVPNFTYSPALKASGIVWTAPNLDRWLAGPTKMAPGVAMGVRVASPQDRADIIAYLRQVPAGHP